MTIDSNVYAAHRLFDEPAIGPLEDEVLGAMEEMDRAYGAWDAQRKELERLFARVISAYIYPGAVLEMHARARGPLCLVGFRVDAGSSRGAHRFEVAGEAHVSVKYDGHPVTTKWYVKAAPISKVTGKVMSGKSHGANSVDNLVTLSGNVFYEVNQFGPEQHEGPDHFEQQCRDAFIKFVADAEAILIKRGTKGAT